MHLTCLTNEIWLCFLKLNSSTRGPMGRESKEDMRQQKASMWFYQRGQKPNTSRSVSLVLNDGNNCDVKEEEVEMTWQRGLGRKTTPWVELKSTSGIGGGSNSPCHGGFCPRPRSTNSSLACNAGRSNFFFFQSYFKMILSFYINKNYDKAKHRVHLSIKMWHIMIGWTRHVTFFF